LKFFSNSASNYNLYCNYLFVLILLFQNEKIYHKRSSSAPSLTKEKSLLSVAGSCHGTLRRKIPQTRKAHFSKASEDEPQRHGLSFKKANFLLDRIPLPTEWEEVELEIDGSIERIYENRNSNIKTRTDPRISIKTHLEELHVTYTAEMISRINNPTAFTTNGDMQEPDLDLPSGTRWGQTDKGEVFFINDIGKTTSWIHPRVEQQLIKLKLPPLNSKRRDVRETDKTRRTSNSPKPNRKSNQIVVEKISHIKQHSIDSGVGSQMGSSNTLRPFTPSKSKDNFRNHYRSISENALVQSPVGFSVHEKDFSGLEESMSPQSEYSDLQSPNSEASCVSPMDTRMERTLYSTDQSFQSLSMNVSSHVKGAPTHSHNSTPNLRIGNFSKRDSVVSEANIFSTDTEMEIFEDPILNDNLLNEVDNIFESLTSNDFLNDHSHDTFIRSLLNDVDLRLSD
jgi:hypothetical protein